MKKILSKKLFRVAAVSLFVFLVSIFLACLYFSYEVAPGKENYQNPINDEADNNFLIAISPHHLVAKTLIENLFSQIKDSDVETVIIISPNHFNQGKGNIQSSLYPKSKLNADQYWIKSMQRERLLSIEDESFSNEHGINNLLPYIEESFPDATIIPIIISETVSDDQSANLTSALNFFRDKKARIILSADFSHYLTNPGAQFHNIHALKTLQNVDSVAASKADIDCPKGLEVIMKIAKLNNFNFQLLDSSNAAILGGNEFVIEPTSYVTGFFSEEKSSVQSDSLNFSFFGDIRQDEFLKYGNEKNNLDHMLADVERLFLGTDFAVANFKSSIGNGNILESFKKRGFDASSSESFVTGKQNNITYALFNYNQIEKDAEEKIISNILNNKDKAEINIVYAAWAENSANTVEDKGGKMLLAHKFIDAGADVVIGNSPDKIDPIEKYGGKYIFYSIGSFFGEESLGVGMNYDDLSERISYYLIPVKFDTNHKQKVIQGDELKSILNSIADSAVADDSIRSRIKSGIIFD
ncbi:MAG: hypothetical protein ACD_15C00042G0004 [uncultured bacterium]|nr:MAG: hypothetical protein ACD_15C00042G0004 [uncultured bacterium]HCU70538.1 AmmeMemoRadiSam system protein B [Candidatus Moranbacteria bacterium]